MPKLNVELLRKVKKHILEEPRRLDMGYWIHATTASPCGTVACLAGWTCILSNVVPAFSLEAGELATPLLGLNERQKMSLFHTEHWPRELAEKYWNARTPGGRARATAKRINLLIKEGR